MYIYINSNISYIVRNVCIPGRYLLVRVVWCVWCDSRCAWCRYMRRSGRKYRDRLDSIVDIKRIKGYQVYCMPARYLVWCTVQLLSIARKITHPLGRFWKLGFSTTGRTYWVRRVMRLCNLNPFLTLWIWELTAVPFWGQTTQTSSSLSPKRDCGSKGVNEILNISRAAVYTLCVPPMF